MKHVSCYLRIVRIVFLGFLLNLISHFELFASCGSASCPIDIHTSEKIEKGMIRLDYSYEYSYQDQPRIGRHEAAVGEISGHHDEVSTLNQIQRLSLDMGLSQRFSLQVILPFVHREHQHIHNHHGTPILESWNFNGMEDMTIQSRFAFWEPDKESQPRLSTLLGAVLPTGRDKAINAEGDEAEPGILPGKGAYSLILGLSSLQAFSAPTLSGPYAKLPLFFSTTYQWNGKGHEDYQIGNVWLANAGLTYPLFPKLGFTTQINLKVNEKDDQGETREEIEKTGGTFVYFSPGFQFIMNENLGSFLYVQIPVYQRVNEIQLTADYNVIAGLSYRFSAL